MSASPPGCCWWTQNGTRLLMPMIVVESLILPGVGELDCWYVEICRAMPVVIAPTVDVTTQTADGLLIGQLLLV
jgi:hypothetical protein